ncbi:MAG: glycosyltransferase family A protein [Chthoniobacteraceae bacterium]
MDVAKSLGDSRVKVVCQETNRGVSAARNAGAAVATGKYLAFLDSDDEWLPEKLALQVAQLEASCRAGKHPRFPRLRDGVRGRPHYLAETRTAPRRGRFGLPFCRKRPASDQYVAAFARAVC